VERVARGRHASQLRDSGRWEGDIGCVRRKTTRGRHSDLVAWTGAREKSSPVDEWIGSFAYRLRPKCDFGVCF
jgi:hypothetical protein